MVRSRQGVCCGLCWQVLNTRISKCAWFVQKEEFLRHCCVIKRFLYWIFRGKKPFMDQGIWAILKVCGGMWWQKKKNWNLTLTQGHQYFCENRDLKPLFGQQFWEQHQTLSRKNPQNYWEKQKLALVLDISFSPIPPPLFQYSKGWRMFEETGIREGYST